MQDRFRSILSESRERTARMIRGITRICRELPPRAPGSPGERAAAQVLAESLRRDCGCSRVTVESFRAHPGAFYGFFTCAAGLELLTWLACRFLPPLGIACGTLTLLLFVFQFVHYGGILDGLFPARQSVNVTGIRPCREAPRQRILLNGHLDAAWEWPLNYHFGGVVFELSCLLAVAGVAYWMILGILALGGDGTGLRTLRLLGLLFVPFWVSQAFLRNRRRTVDGANDNLSGCFLALEVLRALEEHGIVPAHTEIGAILTGSEESGLLGARAWCKFHRADLGDIPTLIYTFDTIHDPRHLMVNLRDLNGTLRADRELALCFRDAAQELEIPCKVGQVPLMGGATDAAAFLRGGFRAVAVTGLNHRLEPYYHTRRDSWDNLNPAGLEACFRAAVRALEKLEARDNP